MEPFPNDRPTRAELPSVAAFLWDFARPAFGIPRTAGCADRRPLWLAPIWPGLAAVILTMWANHRYALPLVRTHHNPISGFVMGIAAAGLVLVVYAWLIPGNHSHCDYEGCNRCSIADGIRPTYRYRSMVDALIIAGWYVARDDDFSLCRDHNTPANYPTK